MIYQYLIFLVY